jgi:beta-galactosidase
MRSKILLAAALALSLSSCTAQTPAPPATAFSSPRLTQSFDADWRFALTSAAGPQAPAFDDSHWQSLDVPHDWSIDGPIDQANPTGKSGGFFPAGIGWYRKHFTIPDLDSTRRVFIELDGVMANSDVYINGFDLGHRPNGYVSLDYELTGHLNFGAQENVLAVRCDNSLQPAGRFYCGAGIYRHVRLVMTDPIHLDHWGTCITTPRVGADLAVIHVVSTLVNQSDATGSVQARTTILGPDNLPLAADQTAYESVPVGGKIDLAQDIYIQNPKLWNLDQPNMYRAVTRLVSDDQTIDEASTPFGIREFHFDPATGFWLNGKNFKILGCCLHADGGAVGEAVPLGVWQRRLEAMKLIGCNAIRTAHNPPSPEFLDLCDRMGFLVMDEMFDVWTIGKTPLNSRTVLNDYHLYFKDWWRQDVTDTVLRDRNHPSIILWSAGNEIHDINPNNDLGTRLFKPLRDLYHELDPTRPVTLAVLRPNQSNLYTNGFAELMDVVGQNYRENELLAAHKQNPNRKILGTENHLDVKTWDYLRDNPPYSGQFLWVGIDYLGESPNWPIIGSGSGMFDRTLLARPDAYQRKSWWTSEPMVRIDRVEPLTVPARPAPIDPGVDSGPPPQPRHSSDWTPRQDANYVADLDVYTNCQQVELSLNGKSLGAQKRNHDDSPLQWHVPYQPGTLIATASNDGKIVATHELRTAGQPARVELSADQSELSTDWDNVSFVRARVVDAAGTLVPDAENLITFHLTGPAVLAAVDNGDPQSHESFHTPQRHAYNGTCLAIVRAADSGPITLTATAAGLADGSVQIQGQR